MTRSITRRALLAATGALMLQPPSRVLGGPESGREKLDLGTGVPFSFERLTESARQRAATPFVPPARPAPEVVAQIDYATHGQIRFRPNHALFAEGPGVYPITFFPLGKYFPSGVDVFVLADHGAAEIVYSPEHFAVPTDNIARCLPNNAGFAGFRIHESRYRDDWRTQDWVAFLGASYFRAIGELGQYGLSARGVAVDTATEDSEDFPNFVEFYISPALREKDPVIVYALLDGARVSGAYKFEMYRTEGVVMDVDMRLFMRREVKRLGIAPLTSMYWFSEHSRRHAVDWRPEVHDSDGLAIWTGAGERLWRPLDNPPITRASSFLDHGPKGFGLLQRDRRVEHYLDGVNYHLRPSLWVEPLSDWGAGAIQLVEIPTDDEIHDNIVAFWVPEVPARAGAAFDLRYRLHWLAEEPYPPKSVAKTVATRLGRGGEPGNPRPEGVWKFVVEFAGGPLETLEPDAEVIPVVTAPRGTIERAVAEPVPESLRWRAQFDVAVPDGDSSDIRLYLRTFERPLTETWLYHFSPPEQA